RAAVGGAGEDPRGSDLALRARRRLRAIRRLRARHCPDAAFAQGQPGARRGDEFHRLLAGRKEPRPRRSGAIGEARSRAGAGKRLVSRLFGLGVLPARRVPTRSRGARAGSRARSRRAADHRAPGGCVPPHRKEGAGGPGVSPRTQGADCRSRAGRTKRAEARARTKAEDAVQREQRPVKSARLMIRHDEGFFSAKDNLRLFWESDVPQRPKAHVGIVHGYADHCGRYRKFIDALVADGFAVHAFDYRGHGQADGRRGYCERFSDFVDDAETFWGRVRGAAGSQKSFLFAHSHGGLMAIHHQMRKPPELAGLVLSAPYLKLALKPPQLKVMAARAIEKIVPWLPIKNEIRPELLTRDVEAQRAVE